MPTVAQLIETAATQYETARAMLAAYDETLEHIISHPDFKAGASATLADGRTATVADTFAKGNLAFRSQPSRRFALEFKKR